MEVSQTATVIKQHMQRKSYFLKKSSQVTHQQGFFFFLKTEIIYNKKST